MVRDQRGRAGDQLCVDCGKQAYDWSHIHETSGESIWHYEPRCRSCHKLYDVPPERRKEIAKLMTDGKRGKPWTDKQRAAYANRRPGSRKCTVGCACRRHPARVNPDS